jgi:molybdate transport system substrate-binding protein
MARDRFDRGRVAGALLLVIALSGCPAGTRPDPEDRVVVFAAASLREVFTELAATFERSHPGLTATLNFAGTQELRAQLEHGAAVDVIASADARHMEELRRAGGVEPPVVFARNELVVILARRGDGDGDGKGIATFAELPNASRVVIGAPEVPIGRYTLQLLDRAAQVLGADFRVRVERKVVSRELSVRQVLAKVSLGEAQAGVVYRSDAEAARGRVTHLVIPAEVNVVAEYPIALVTGAAHPRRGRAFVDLVRSTEGRRALRAAGFALPRPAGAPP